MSCPNCGTSWGLPLPKLGMHCVCGAVFYPPDKKKLRPVSQVFYAASQKLTKDHHPVKTAKQAGVKSRTVYVRVELFAGMHVGQALDRADPMEHEVVLNSTDLYFKDE